MDPHLIDLLDPATIFIYNGAVLRIRIRDLVLFYPLDPDPG
jgi:hypothetical protein